MYDFTEFAACRGMDTNLFFPVGTDGPALLQIAEAKTVCARCPVIESCRAFALAHPLEAEFGVWGGLDEYERRDVRELRRVPAA